MREIHSLQRFGEVLDQLQGLSWRLAIFVPEQQWSLDMPCAVLDPNDVDDDDDDAPPFALKHNLHYAMSIQDAQGVRTNLVGQLGEDALTQAMLMDACRYYVDHDAFLYLK